MGIGASAGGLEAFSRLLQGLPLDTGMAFVLVQHLDPAHESVLAALLARCASLPVCEITDNQRVEPDHIYVIPPNASLAITHGRLRLQKRKDSDQAQRVIDSFLVSLAQDQHERAIAVVLSGTASDGTAGLEAIKAEGGITFAQDETAKYDSMPRSAVAAGCVDFVLSPEGIALELARLARHPFVTGAGTPAPGSSARAVAVPSGSTSAGDETAPAASERGSRPALRTETGFQQILGLLRKHSTIDFSLYRPSAIERRITRRMVLNRADTVEDYAGALRGNATELEALCSDLLISVTSFFRDPEVFEELKRKVFPKLLPPQRREPARVWVPGCSTGEEAYSIAMALLESCGQAASETRLQVFATDVNEALLERARQGLYAKALAEQISPERLRRFFVEEQGGYRVSKRLRQRVVFARQNLLSDPPFSRLDLISCRNVLIYIESNWQSTILPAFHYALRPGGFLLLGKSESIGRFTDLFEPVDKKLRIFARKPAATPLWRLPRPKARSAEQPGLRPPGRDEPPKGAPLELNALREAQRLTINRFAPPSVLLDAGLRVLEFRGATGAYLEPPPGKASFDLLKMARPGLMLPLRAALQRAKREGKAIRRENVRVKTNGGTRCVNLEVIPLRNLKERCYLVFFEEVQPRDRGDVARKGRERVDRAGAAPKALPTTALARRLRESERELAETRDYLQSVHEQQETANEELQASNEEITSANEELQSINEELETSKEELESGNEELMTLNDELARRNTELDHLNTALKEAEQHITDARDFAQSVVESVPPLLILSGDLRVQTANESFYQAFRVTPAATEHHLIYELGNGQWDVPGLRRLLEEILPQDNRFKHYEITREFEGLGRRTLLLSGRRMQSRQNIVLSIEDITERKQAEEALRQAKEELAQYAAQLEQFSHALAHDLRAPLRAMQTYASLLGEQVATGQDAQSADWLRRIKVAAARLDALVRDSLDYSQILRQELPLQAVDVAGLLRGMLDTYPNLQGPAVEIKLELERLLVLGNQAALTQVFSNLLGNAVKFVSPGVRPRVRVWAESVPGREPAAGGQTSRGIEDEAAPGAARSEPSRVRICVEDNGIGIPAAAHERIFEMFYRLHSESEYPGTGIGLAIVSQAVKRMGGQLGLQSEPGKGSRFWIELPGSAS